MVSVIDHFKTQMTEKYSTAREKPYPVNMKQAEKASTQKYKIRALI